MEKSSAHPSREELSAYSLGQLPEERAVAIDSHISECEPCCETIVELSSEDTFAGLLQEAGRRPADLTADHDSATANSSSNPDDIPPPLTEHPRYEVLGLIGKGGMGDVYNARHRKMERQVALKVINRGLVRKAEAIDRFHREVKAAAQLSHSNIVTAYDADHAGDFHFMVMEFVDGVDLSQTVNNRGALPVAEACDYIRQAAIGLQHAHERGMVHRDIKPHNLMVTADGIIKILDFGLASLAPEASPASEAVAARSDLTVAGAIMGTPDFISPEQANDARQVDIRSDIYSLGATLYYLLSGRVPFDDGSVMHKLRSHAHVEPAPLNSMRDDVPEELAAIASKMMAKDPDERYLTPKEVADALEAFLRTWQPGEANSQGQLLAGAGNSFVSGAKHSSAGDAGRNWLLIVAALFVVGCLAASLYYANGNIGGIRVEATGPEHLGSLGTHPLTIVDTSGKKPLGGTSSTHQDDASGITTHSFESANGRYKIMLVNKLLTVNGEKYTLKNPTDAIRIVDDRVEITRVAGLGTKKVDPTDRGERAEVTPASDGLAAVGDPGTSPNSKPVSECAAIQAALREYYMDKYPLFAASVNQNSNILSDPSKLREREWLRQIGELGSNSPVSEVINSFPGKPFVTFTEVTEATRNEVLVLCVNLYRSADETCRVELTKKQRKKRAGEPVAVGKPISEEEVHKLVRRVAKNSDVQQLQGDWESVSVIEGGTQLSSKDGFSGLLLSIKGDTFVITKRKLNGEQSEVDTGRIEINSTAIPKTIDFIGSAERRPGIYELKDGVLRICLAEKGGTDAPAEGRAPDASPLQRPTTFDSPAGSNRMLMEFTGNQPAKEKDILEIQGTWQVTYSEDGGRIAPQEMLRQLRFVIDEQNLTTEIGGRKSVSKYTLDPSTNPKSIDLTEHGRTKPGIYDLVGDTLRICIAENAEQRPTAFDSQPNSANDIVLILKRLQPEATSSADIDDHLHAGPLTPKLARALIPKASSISNEDFLKLQTNPSAQSIKSKSLSLVFMTLDISNQSAEDASDFRYLVEGFPHPSDIATAMAISRPKGYISIIQPDYITECKITNSTNEIAQGKVTFNAPKLYIGSATFEARKHEGTWRIEKFQLPSRQISIVLGEDGNWYPAGKEAEANQAPAPSDSTPDETPDSSLSNAANIESLPLVQVLYDAEGLTAKRVKIIGTFLVTDDKFGVRSYRISTAQEDLPPRPNEDAYSDREVTFKASFDDEKMIVGQFHNKRVLATGSIYFFPADSDSPAEALFMMDGIDEYHPPSANTKDPQPLNDDQSLIPSNSQPGNVDSPNLALSPDITSRKTAEAATGKVDQYDRLFQLRILLLQKSQALLDSIVDEATAEKATASWYNLFPIQVETEYLDGRLVDFTELNDRRSEARKKYGPQIEKARQQLRELQGECLKLPFFDQVNRVQLEYSEALLSVTPFEIQHGHAWRASGPQFVIWLPPGTISKTDLSLKKDTLEVLIVDEETGAVGCSERAGGSHYRSSRRQPAPAHCRRSWPASSIAQQRAGKAPARLHADRSTEHGHG